MAIVEIVTETEGADEAPLAAEAAAAVPSLSATTGRTEVTEEVTEGTKAVAATVSYEEVTGEMVNAVTGPLVTAVQIRIAIDIVIITSEDEDNAGAEVLLLLGVNTKADCLCHHQPPETTVGRRGLLWCV